MKTLEQELREQTADLKTLYFEKTKEYARTKYEYSQKIMTRSTEDWCKYFGIEPRIVCNRAEFPVNFHNTANAKKRYTITNEARNIYYMGIDKFAGNELMKAELHYESSLAKLVNRLIDKGLTDTNFTIVEKSIGVNFELVIEHNGKRTRCWTIIAEGEIQRPHYRYLIK